MSKSDLDVLHQTISDTQSNICQAVIVKEGKLIYADTWNQKYMEDLTDMQNHVLPYLQFGRKRCEGETRTAGSREK